MLAVYRNYRMLLLVAVCRECTECCCMVAAFRNYRVLLIALYRNYRVGERSRQERESLRYKRFLLTINFTAIGRIPSIHGFLFLFFL